MTLTLSRSHNLENKDIRSKSKGSIILKDIAYIFDIHKVDTLFEKITSGKLNLMITFCVAHDFTLLIPYMIIHLLQKSIKN